MVEPLFQFTKRGFNGFEIWQVFRRRGLFAVLNDAVFINDERSARRGIANACEHGEQNIVSFSRGLVQIARESDADFFLLGPGCLSKRTVHADADHVRVHAGVCRKASGHVAHLRGANAGKSQRKKQHNGILLAEVVAEFDFHVRGRFGFQGEVRSFGADRYCHSYIGLIVLVQFGTTKRILTGSRVVSNFKD